MYVVSSSNVNIRQTATAKSLVWGQLSKGDTIVPVDHVKKRIGFEYKGKTAYVYSKNVYPAKTNKEILTKEASHRLPGMAAIIKTLDKYTQCKTLSYLDYCGKFDCLLFLYLGKSLGRRLILAKEELFTA